MSNRISKIVTKTGDDGTTSLADGSRVDKDSLRIQAIGTIDELNSHLGVIIATGISDDVSAYLLNIQHRLFDIGGEIAVPGNAVCQKNRLSASKNLLKHIMKIYLH